MLKLCMNLTDWKHTRSFQIYKILIIKPDSTVLRVESNDKELRKWLGGGWLEQITLSDELVAYVDEDGISKGLEYNARATNFVVKELGKERTLMGEIRGNMIVAGQIYGDDGFELCDVPPNLKV